MTKSDIVSTIEKQHGFFSQGKTRPVETRLHYLRKLKATLVKYEHEIIAASRKDMGRPDVETYFMDVAMNVDEADYAIRHIRQWTKPQKKKTPLWLFRSESAVYPEPFGTVLIMSAWNFPILQLISPLIGAIAAGNTAILKPSPESPALASVAQKIIKDVFPPEYVVVLSGDTDVAAMLLEERFDHIFFTGSSRVGRIVMEAAAKHLTPVTLELGGKSPAIVDEDADIDAAAKHLVWAKYYNAGQVCVAVDHVYVHENVQSQFITAAIRYIKQFYGEDLGKSPDMGFMVDERNFQRAVGYLKEGTIVYGGKTEPARRFIAPTILCDITDTAHVLRDEIFAPILPVLGFSDLGKLIAQLRVKPKPLALYYFSRSKARQKRIIQETSSGGITINDTYAHGGTIYLPFGGVGNSGMGAYHGKKTFETFTHYKAVLTSRMLFDSPLKYPPYAGKLAVLKKIFKLLPHF